MVLLILGEHGLRVGEVHDVVVECLNEVVIAVPTRYLVEIEVCIRAVEVDDVLKGRETAGGVYRYAGTLIAVLEHLAEHDAGVWCACLGLYHDVDTVHGAVKIACRCRRLYVFQSVLAVPVGADDKLLARQHKAQLVAHALYDFRASPGDIFHHERQAQCHSVGRDAGVGKGLVSTLGGNVLGHTQGHPSLCLLCAEVVCHKAVGRIV